MINLISSMNSHDAENRTVIEVEVLLLCNTPYPTSSSGSNPMVVVLVLVVMVVMWWYTVCSISISISFSISIISIRIIISSSSSSSSSSSNSKQHFQYLRKILSRTVNVHMCYRLPERWRWLDGTWYFENESQRATEKNKLIYEHMLKGGSQIRKMPIEGKEPCSSKWY